ncbi:MAG: hypothetical protein A2Y62_18840 [Candidatus Fischerbacteria bacterium RBG_13_37_8]|uniref:DNA 5'-3' helicase n=1 Tax=Candidatus Fischerbacteria bacterium RBG_13_37_8 TaxID=1817863 RepID=A0A1F5VJP2_9BACT|nr:MAG: hypothetical protein A2Y62_18840 [Candidatus Fischerbacteria bacterium RBG_13_37_8]
MTVTKEQLNEMYSYDSMGAIKRAEQLLLCIELDECMIKDHGIDFYGEQEIKTNYSRMLISKMPETIFYDDRHKYIHIAMRELYKQGKFVNPEAIADYLHSNNLLDKAGGIAYIKAETHDDVTMLNEIAPFYQVNQADKKWAYAPDLISFLKDKWIERQADLLFNKYKNKQNKARQDLFILGMEFQKLASISGKLLRACDITFEENEGQQIFTNIGPIDDKIELYPGDMVVIGGRPSCGKTALAMTLALAMRKYNPVFFSVETGKESLFQRFLAIEKNIELTTVRRNWEEYKKEKIKSDLLLSFERNISVNKFCMQLAGAITQYNSKIAFVDYLQLMNVSGKYFNENLRVGHISNALKAFALQYGIVLFVCSQLRRPDQSRKDKNEPQLADLRDSGVIEQDADVVFMLWNNKNDQNPDYKIKIGKNRNGPTGKIENVQFLPAFVSWDWNEPAQDETPF